MEVGDSDAVFSRRLGSNWDELPRTLRRKQKHRPDILSQFTDVGSESESEPKIMVEKPDPNELRRSVKRSEFLRRLESRNLLQFNRMSAPPLGELRLRYEAHDVKRLSQPQHNQLHHSEDDERKTNSPDSLLVRSTDSESTCSDDYGHTDDSGAFLEHNKASSSPPHENHNDKKKNKKDSGAPLRQRFARLFHRQQTEQSDHKNHKLDHNKNDLRPKSAIGIVNLAPHRFEYENIPRIEMGNVWRGSSRHSTGSSTVVQNQPQPSIEQLRMEEGCQLRNHKNTFGSENGSEDM